MSDKLNKQLIERLLDLAFSKLQHNTGEQNPEYVWQRDQLRRAFEKTIHGRFGDLVASPAVPVSVSSRGWIEKLIDYFDPEGTTTIEPDDASCYINALRELLAASPAPAIPGRRMSDQKILDIAKRVTPAFRESPASCIALVREVFKDAPAISESDLLALLPGTTYMDEPDGGSPSLLEQLQRMAEDAARYRWLRDVHIGDDPEAIELNSASEYGLDAAIDAARKGGKS